MDYGAYYYNLVGVPTWKCGYSCSYCDYKWSDNGNQLTCFGQDFTFDDYMSVDEWVDGLNWLTKDKVSTIDFTGGEPLVYKDFASLTNRLPNNFLWAMTTSLQNAQFKELNYTRCVGMTCSYHYQIDVDEFVKNIEWLKKKDLAIGITIVATPWNFDEFKKAYYTLLKTEKTVNIQVYCTKDFSWEKDYVVEMEQLKPFLKDEHVKHSNSMFSWSGIERKRCSAGRTSGMIMPDGVMYRCYMNFITKGHKMADLKEPFLYAPVFNENCDLKCMFVCDRERAEEVTS